MKNLIACCLILVFAFMSVFPSTIYADEAEDNEPEAAVVEQEPFIGQASADSPPEEEPAEYGRNFPMALALVTASNFAIWAWDLIGMQEYARVTPWIWGQNLKKGMEWDTSDFFTNQMLHPLHGGTYYTAARSYGFSYWESIPFALLGSVEWWFGERDVPSTNDTIVTTMGGMAIGEAGYRLAVAFSNTDEDGARGVFRTLAAWVVNPMYMVNRAVFGDSYVKRNKLPWTPIDIRLRTGVNYTHDDDERFSPYPHAYIGVQIAYGDPWKGEYLYGPYDFFDVRCGGEPDWRNPSWDIFADAILCGFKFGNAVQGILGLYQQFDFMESLVYKLAANGAGVGGQFYIPFARQSSIELNAYFYGLALGVMDSRYTRWENNRKDIKGPGWSCKLGLKYDAGGWFSIRLAYHYYWVHTLDGADRENTAHIYIGTLDVPLTDTTSVGLEGRYYERWSDAGFDNAWAWSVKAYVSFKL